MTDGKTEVRHFRDGLKQWPSNGANQRQLTTDSYITFWELITVLCHPEGDDPTVIKHEWYALGETGIGQGGS
jgi:hypothetical protein